MPISIFAQPPHTNTNPAQPFDGKPPKNGHLMRVSSIIRGEQIAQRLGARLNPESGYADDVCIYVKPHVPFGRDFDFDIPKRAYLDIVDGWRLVNLVRQHPEMGVIACSRADYDALKSILPNRVVLIPQHHCNFERARRTREGVTRVGVIGTDLAFGFLPVGLALALAQRGIELECYSKFYSRQDIIDFYQRIDVQLVWRPYRMRLANPLKIVNAASFGVPTIALDEPYFREADSAYVTAANVDEIMSRLDNLRSARLYADFSAHCLEVAEPYHIDHIAKLYRSLP